MARFMVPVLTGKAGRVEFGYSAVFYAAFDQAFEAHGDAKRASEIAHRQLVAVSQDANIFGTVNPGCPRHSEHTAHGREFLAFGPALA